LFLNAQTGTLSGNVTSDNGKIPYAKILLDDTQYGAISDKDGNFIIENIPYGDYKVKISSVGFKTFSDATKINEKSNTLNPILEDNNLQLNEVVVTGTMRETMISKSPVKIEVINSSFFKTNPVNSVIEALNTVNGVQEQINCSVCGTNDIHINGMEGPYTLVLIDGMPIVSGLSSVYGFNGIPTSLINRVEIVKGPSSTLYGTEAVGGVINIITKAPEKTPLIDFESNYSSHQEFKTSFGITPKIGKNIYTTISADYFYFDNKMDFNDDNFTDVPLSNRLSLFNKWQFNDKNGKTVLNLAGRYFIEDRFGGTLQWTPEDKGSNTIYGETVNTKRLEVIGSFIFPTKNRNLKLDFSGNSHLQNSWYGNVNYKANQQVYFSNFIWSKQIKKRNYLLVGMTNKISLYEDNTTSATDEKTYIPGIFIQDEFDWTENLKLLGGFRFDYHSAHGLIFSPRFSLKKQFTDYTAFRFNYGNGFRQVHLFTEDHAFFSGARTVMIMNELKPERSHNATLNLNHTYNALGYGNVDIDVFYTYFMNKILPDYDFDPQLIVYDNLNGHGITQGVSLAINHSFEFPLRMRLGATIQNVYQVEEDEFGELTKEQQVFTPAFSGTYGLSYEIKKIGLTINYNGKVMGPQHLPTFPEPFSRPEISPWFSIQNFQITKTFKHNFEIYAGIKNLLNYTQPSPLIDSENPFGDNFDTSFAYGPLQVRRFYGGLRWNLERRKSK